MALLIMESRVTSYEVFIFLSQKTTLECIKSNPTYYTTLVSPLKKMHTVKIINKFLPEKKVVLEFVKQIFEKSTNVCRKINISFSIPRRYNIQLLGSHDWENLSANSLWDISVATFLSFIKKAELRRYSIQSFLVLTVCLPAQKGFGVHNMSDKRFKINISIFFNNSVPKYKNKEKS